MLGIHIDDQLIFNVHISNICKSVSKQLNAFVRLKCFLAFEERKVLINSFILASLNYYPAAWSISSANSLLKVHNDYGSAYEELKTTINIRNYCAFVPWYKSLELFDIPYRII